MVLNHTQHCFWNQTNYIEFEDSKSFLCTAWCKNSKRMEEQTVRDRDWHSLIGLCTRVDVIMENELNNINYRMTKPCWPMKVEQGSQQKMHIVIYYLVKTVLLLNKTTSEFWHLVYFEWVCWCKIWPLNKCRIQKQQSFVPLGGVCYLDLTMPWSSVINHFFKRPFNLSLF